MGPPAASTIGLRVMSLEGPNSLHVFLLGDVHLPQFATSTNCFIDLAPNAIARMRSPEWTGVQDTDSGDFL